MKTKSKEIAIRKLSRVVTGLNDAGSRYLKGAARGINHVLVPDTKPIQTGEMLDLIGYFKRSQNKVKARAMSVKKVRFFTTENQQKRVQLAGEIMPVAYFAKYAHLLGYQHPLDCWEEHKEKDLQFVQLERPIIHFKWVKPAARRVELTAQHRRVMVVRQNTNRFWFPIFDCFEINMEGLKERNGKGIDLEVIKKTTQKHVKDYYENYNIQVRFDASTDAAIENLPTVAQRA